MRGISIEESDEVVGMICVEPDSKQDVLVLSENGYGKRTDLDEYRITNRGGKGVKTINMYGENRQTYLDTGRYGRQRPDDYQPFGTYHTHGSVSQIRLAGRATQGVRIINLREGDAIASVMAVPAAGDEEEEVQSAEGRCRPEAQPRSGPPAEE